ncbi:hypothetical protein AMS68_003306 [Peltaster fructicola]|uniref:OBG-type G domain-containing protein n=1 Tax=Peltaster fructicola TaxID=286661 RepID=A0A6H0XT44_9PEZI|nr:hypothetical protein AMS68_003306 [Peltaster fructicola]
MNLHCGLRQLSGSLNATRKLWSLPRGARNSLRHAFERSILQPRIQDLTTVATPAEDDDTPSRSIDVNQYDHLNPRPLDYSSTPFTDACTVTLASGAGGHGCISFLREKYIPDGPANGGDGGTGGNVYIQAVRGETSLHKIARRRMIKAGRGKNGQGAMKGGKRGDDVIIVVPVGTVIREIKRRDPVEDELARDRREETAFRRNAEEEPAENEEMAEQTPRWQRDKWLLYPGTLPKSFTSAEFPPLPRARRSNIALTAPPAPIRFDLDTPMSAPMLLAAGAMGGLGNPHFVTKSSPRPKFATKGDEGVTLELQLELKLLADVGLVGLPNAGELRTHFTIADIPGLIEGAHLDKGLGLDFLRHIERAAVLAFVVDLSAGDAVQALKGLWTELREYEKLRQEGRPQAIDATAYKPFASTISPFLEEEVSSESAASTPAALPRLVLPPLDSKPWLVVATKADLDDSRDNFLGLQAYLSRVKDGTEEHPAKSEHAWRATCGAVPVCAMRKENTEQVLDGLVKLLERRENA